VAQAQQLGDDVNVSKSKENQHTSMSKSSQLFLHHLMQTKEVVPFQQHLGTPVGHTFV